MTALELAEKKLKTLPFYEDKPTSDEVILAQEVIRLTKEIEDSHRGLAGSRVAEWENGNKHLK